MLAAPVHQQVVCPLGPVPPAIAVHREVPTHDRTDPAGARVGHPAVHGLEVAGAGGGKRVAPVGERVQHQIRHVQLRAQPDQGLQVKPTGMDAAIGNQADQVHALGARERLAQHLV